MFVELLRHYPQLVRSCAISGSAVSGYARWERALICGQAPLRTTRWHRAAQARAYGIGEEEKELFVLTTSSPSRETNMRLVREAGFGAIPKRPTKTFAYDGPFLAVCAKHDSASIRRAFGPPLACFPPTAHVDGPRNAPCMERGESETVHSNEHRTHRHGRLARVEQAMNLERRRPRELEPLNGGT